jgi:hypothetical protein
MGFKTHAGQAIRQIDGVMGPDAGHTVRFGALSNFWTNYFFRCEHLPDGTEPDGRPIRAQSVRVELADIPTAPADYLKPRTGVTEDKFVAFVLLWRQFLLHGTCQAVWSRVPWGAHDLSSVVVKRNSHQTCSSRPLCHVVAAAIMETVVSDEQGVRPEHKQPPRVSVPAAGHGDVGGDWDVEDESGGGGGGVGHAAPDPPPLGGGPPAPTDRLSGSPSASFALDRFVSLAQCIVAMQWGVCGWCNLLSVGLSTPVGDALYWSPLPPLLVPSALGQQRAQVPGSWASCHSTSPSSAWRQQVYVGPLFPSLHRLWSGPLVCPPFPFGVVPPPPFLYGVHRWRRARTLTLASQRC